MPPRSAWTLQGDVVLAYLALHRSRPFLHVFRTVAHPYVEHAAPVRPYGSWRGQAFVVSGTVLQGVGEQLAWH